MNDDPRIDAPEKERERWHSLARVEDWLERPMLVLSFVWLCLVLSELIWTTSAVLEQLGTFIWILFVLEFLIRLALAPRRLRFLRRNPVTLIALIAPAFRFLRALRLFRFGRGIRLVRILGTASRGFGAIRKSFDQRGLGYVLATTALVIVLGAGGMFAFEPEEEISGGFAAYGDALWWTAMLVSTIGSGFSPVTTEGRLLALLLAIYGLAVFGYLTASFATFFIEQEVGASDSRTREISALRADIAALRDEVRQMSAR